MKWWKIMREAKPHLICEKCRKCSWIVRCCVVDLDVIAWCEKPYFEE